MSVYGIHVGNWVNWSNGPILGATLTVTSKSGSFIIAFLAVFVTCAGNQLWNIWTFYLHQSRSTPEARDALHHQQQLLLRTGFNDLTFFWRLLRMNWSSRMPPFKTLGRNLPLATFAIVHMLLFFAASLLASRIANPNGEVLLTPYVCGWPAVSYVSLLRPNFGGDNGPEDAFYMGGNFIYKLGKVYAGSCYAQTSGSTTGLCNQFVKQSLPYKQIFNDSCPFEDQVCETPTISFDTGMLSSHDDLGINTPEDHRITFRKKMSCSTIAADEKFSSPWTFNATASFWPWEADAGPGALYKYYYLGNQDFEGYVTPYTFWVTNSTSSFDNAYKIFILGAYPDDSIFTQFNPIAELNRSDTDVSLLGMKNQALYLSPVNDPFFKATAQKNGSLFYTADQIVSMIGCTEQYQFCNGKNCTKLDSLMGLTREKAASINYNPTQLAVYDIVYFILLAMRIQGVITLMQDEVLLARERLFGSYHVSSSLPDNQWQQELSNYFNVSLSVAQYMAIMHAAAKDMDISGNETYYDYVLQENTTEAKNLCKNQKMRNDGYYSISIFGFSTILVSGTIIILIGMFAPGIAQQWRRRQPQSALMQYKEAEWKSEDILRLHELALEGNGILSSCFNKEMPSDDTSLKPFKLPWLAEWWEKSFYIEDDEKSMHSIKATRPSRVISADGLLKTLGEHISWLIFQVRFRRRRKGGLFFQREL